MGIKGAAHMPHQLTGPAANPENLIADVVIIVAMPLYGNVIFQMYFRRDVIFQCWIVPRGTKPW